MKRLTAGAAARRSAITGRHRVGELAEPPHRRAAAREEGREACSKFCSSRVAALGGRSRDLLGLSMKSASVARGRAASGPATASESSARSASISVLAGEDRQRPCRSRCSAGLARRIGLRSSSPRPARPTPNSLRMIAKRWRWGRRMMLLSRSMSTGVACLVDRQQVLALAVAVARSSAATAAPARRRRAAASACTRRTSRRSATAGGSCTRVAPEVLEAGVGRSRGRRRPCCRA